jgi:transposase InsO family protein
MQVFGLPRHVIRAAFVSCLDRLQPWSTPRLPFNHHRPHQALGGQTPAEYLAYCSSKTLASHMC